MLCAVALGDILEFGHNAPAGLGLRESEVDGLLVRRNLDALDLFQLLDAALNLLGLRRLVAEAVDEGFQLLDALALIGDRRRPVESRRSLFCCEIFFVVAGVEVNAACSRFRRCGHGDVEKIAVVRDQHEGERILQQILLEPVAGFEIEVVGGLVEQQQVRLFEQQLGQRDAHLPAAGEFLGAARPVFLPEAQTVQHRAHLRFDGVAVARVEFASDALVALGHLRVFGGAGSISPIWWVSSSISCSSRRRSAKTDMHSSKTVRPESVRPSCGR